MSDLNEPKKVVLTQAQYEDLIGRVSKLETADEIASKPKKITTHIANLMFFEGKPIVEFNDLKTKEMHDDSGNTFYVASEDIEFSVLEDGKLVKKKANYKGLLENGVRYPCEIVKTEKEEVEVNQGPIESSVISSPTDQANIDKKNSDFIPHRVKLVQNIVKAVVTVLIKDGPMKGKTLTLNQAALNQ